MGEEMEIAAAASVGGLTTGEHHPVTPHRPCANCGAIVDDRYCPRCGQLGSDFHRPFVGLVLSSLADTFSLDGRLWRSVPLLLFRPGRLTRNYLDGKRARYVPPFRMFLLASLLFFLTVFGLGDRLGWYKDWKLDLDGPGGVIVQGPEKDDTLAKLKEELAQPGISDAQRQVLEETVSRIESGETDSPGLIADGKVDRDAVNAAIDEKVEGATDAEVETMHAAADKVADVLENQDKFAARFREWAPRFSLMFMPLLALMLTLLYAWRRSVFVYDHVITALHFQTFVYVLLTLLLLCGALFRTGAGWLVTSGSVLVIWYLYRQIRVTYGTGRFMAGLRTSVLLFLGISVLVLLGVGLVILSFLLT
ncbi:MAG: DUF3667 domain-containing protein [Hyphomonas sp.]